MVVVSGQRISNLSECADSCALLEILELHFCHQELVEGGGEEGSGLVQSSRFKVHLGGEREGRTADDGDAQS